MSKTNDYYNQRPLEHLTDEELANLVRRSARQIGNRITEPILFELFLRYGEL